MPSGAGAFARGKGFTAVRELEMGESTRVGRLTITAVAAVHPGRRSPWGVEAESVGYVVEGSNRIYFAGDTDLFDAMAELSPGLDLALVPVWGWGPNLGAGHLDPERAAQAVAMLKPRIAVPIHWGTIYPMGLRRLRPGPLADPPRRFAAQASKVAPGVDVRILAPGEELTMTVGR